MEELSMIDEKICNYLRVISCLEIERAKSGHPGVCLGAAPIFWSIYKNAFFCPDKPNFVNRDRVVFSAGHASALLYATLNLLGFDIPLNQLKNFRQLGSITPGHPEVNVTPGVDVSTGPLGQGIANAVGFAIAEEYLRNYFSKENLTPINHYTYCFCGDGCLMEGVAQEAISIAGNLKLNKLILLYDKNNTTIEGDLSLANSEDTKAKFLSCNWNVIEVKEGNSVDKIDEAILKAKGSDKPTVIIVNTHIGFGSELEGSNKSHGNPLNLEQIAKLRQNLNYSMPDWQITEDIKGAVKQIKIKNQEIEKSYFNTLKMYKEKYPKEFSEFLKLEDNFKIDFSSMLEQNENLEFFDGRKELNLVLNEICKNVPNIIGGCADVGPSTKAVINDSGYFSRNDRKARNIPYGVREHAMGAISNGITLHSSLRAFCSTFFSFENYLSPAIRMSALMKNPVLYLFTHDSFTVGEDGPTHQPVEQIATLRCLPDIYNFRPCGRKELLAAFASYFNKNLPHTALVSRDKTDFIEDNFELALKGAYVLKDTKNYVATLVATGSEVALCQKVVDELKKKKINLRLVSAPCVELFEKQLDNYKNLVIDKTKPVFCVEASGDNIWYKYATNENCVFNFNHFGKSAPKNILCEEFGFTYQNISKKILQELNKI